MAIYLPDTKSTKRDHNESYHQLKLGEIYYEEFPSSSRRGKVFLLNETTIDIKSLSKQFKKLGYEEEILKKNKEYKDGENLKLDIENRIESGYYQIDHSVVVVSINCHVSQKDIIEPFYNEKFDSKPKLFFFLQIPSSELADGNENSDTYMYSFPKEADLFIYVSVSKECIEELSSFLQKLYECTGELFSSVFIDYFQSKTAIPTIHETLTRRLQLREFQIKTTGGSNENKHIIKITNDIQKYINDIEELEDDEKLCKLNALIDMNKFRQRKYNIIELTTIFREIIVLYYV